MSIIAKQDDFWSNNPCGTDGDYHAVKNHRYAMEPYLTAVLSDLVCPDAKYLEVGCGQGIDALTLCHQLPQSSSYQAIDFSVKSIEQAKNHAAQLQADHGLAVMPEFAVGNALELAFDNNYFDVVYSMGVLHHTANTQQAINEVYRVLKPGGRAVIFLYRTGSIKVEVAKLLRWSQRVIDKVFRTNRCFYQLMQHQKSKKLGTMLLECFGVPVLESYTKAQALAMFSQFGTVKVSTVGNNLPFFMRFSQAGNSTSGYFLKIDVTK